MRRVGLVAVALLLLAILAFELSKSWPAGRLAAGNLEDYGGALASAQALDMGLNPFAHYATLPAAPGLVGNTPNIDLPLSLLLFHPLSLVPPILGFWLMVAASAAGYLAALAALRLLYPSIFTPLRLLWALTFTPFWIAVTFNQIYVALLLVALFGLDQVRRGNDIPAALAIGLLVALKPNLAVWPALLFLAGHRRLGVTALAGAALVSLLPAAFFGPGIYGQWYAAVAGAGDQVRLAANVSLWGFFGRLGATWIGQGLSAALLAALALWAWCTRPSPQNIYPVAVAAALLANAVAWAGYLVLLLPWFLGRRWTPVVRIVAVACVAPFPSLGWIYTAALLAIAGETLAHRRTTGSEQRGPRLLMVQHSPPPQVLGGGD